MTICIYEAQRTPKRLSPNRATVRHIKFSKVKDKKKKDFKGSKRKERSCIQENPRRVLVISPSKLFRQGDHGMTFKIMKGKNCWPRILCQEKLPFSDIRGLRIFSKINKSLSVQYHQICFIRNAKRSYLSGSKNVN